MKSWMTGNKLGIHKSYVGTILHLHQLFTPLARLAADYIAHVGQLRSRLLVRRCWLNFHSYFSPIVSTVCLKQANRDDAGKKKIDAPTGKIAVSPQCPL